ncbi:hypothetical protein GAO09_10675 [Rhizobiales bacterium RZME27]|uniref:Uncharacterized protein n=1 Tax=Endobacterium cereale TaxID=2663029 RepID=A0A6A8A9D6_9HYPH|nr:hypothetical protein [Endobacterium cereale]MEB2846773.1 hypothetical protein [Endobacterium cereale]MQY46508.1 hypothetical protein [Endobacterium cereale]
MTDQDNKLAELGPIARELMKLADELRELADTPLFKAEDVANDDAPPARKLASQLT